MSWVLFIWMWSYSSVGRPQSRAVLRKQLCVNTGAPSPSSDYRPPQRVGGGGGGAADWYEVLTVCSALCWQTACTVLLSPLSHTVGKHHPGKDTKLREVTWLVPGEGIQTRLPSDVSIVVVGPVPFFCLL